MKYTLQEKQIFTKIGKNRQTGKWHLKKHRLIQNRSMDKHYISSEKLSFGKIAQLLNNKTEICLSEQATEAIKKCRNYLDHKMEKQEEPIYGVNTGFGSLCDVSISKSDLGRLQRNQVMSHACGAGDEVPKIIVKLMLLLKVQSLSYGHSGVQLKTVQRLIDMYNRNVLPVIYQHGSLGASGDLAPLAHMCLPLIGEGMVYNKGERRKAKSKRRKPGTGMGRH